MGVSGEDGRVAGWTIRPIRQRTCTDAAERRGPEAAGECERHGVDVPGVRALVAKCLHHSFFKMPKSVYGTSLSVPKRV